MDGISIPLILLTTLMTVLVVLALMVLLLGLVVGAAAGGDGTECGASVEVEAVSGDRWRGGLERRGMPIGSAGNRPHHAESREGNPENGILGARASCPQRAEGP